MITFRPRRVPLALLAAGLAAFGLLVPWLGFYWDDWPTLWFLHSLGPGGFGEVFTSDRPLLGQIFVVTTSLFGTSAPAWQLFGVVTRWLTALAMWWTLRGLWPRHNRQVAWVAFLFLLYPGFQQQYISVTYSNAWIILLVFLLSFGAMIWAFRKPAWFWPLTVISWLLAGISPFLSEYYFGLELLRPVLLWILLSDQPSSWSKRLAHTALRWAPYALLMGLFLIWRLMLHETPRGQIQIFEKLTQNPEATTLSLGRTILVDMLEGSLLAWGGVFNFPKLLGLGTVPSAFYLGVTLLAIPLAIFYWLRFHDPPQDNDRTLIEDPSWGRQAVLLGVLALLFSGIPFWVTRLPIELRFPWDRFTLTMMLGSSLLLAGLVSWLVRSHRLQAVIVGILLGLAVGYQAQTANLYRRDYQAIKDFFWQLSWRAPSIQPGTLLLATELPFLYETDNSLSAPMNWMYAPQASGDTMPYLVYAAESRLGSRLPAFTEGIAIEQEYRTVVFKGTTSQAIVVFYTPPGCVKVADPLVDARLHQKPKYLDDMLPLSRPDLISPDGSAATPPEQVLGTEPAHDWCYYFEKADLARQRSNWREVVRLGEQAFQLEHRLYEVNVAELVPFIEGYAHQGQWQRAVELSQQAYQVAPRSERLLCAAWQRLQAATESGPERSAALGSIQSTFGCKLP